MLYFAFITENYGFEAGGHAGGIVTTIGINQADIPQQWNQTKRVARKVNADMKSWLSKLGAWKYV